MSPLDDELRRILWSSLGLLHELTAQRREHREIEASRVQRELLGDPRHADTRRLVRHGFKIYSQNDEDGIIAEVFRRIGVASRTFFEIGAGDGLENNTLTLLTQGWSGLWCEPHPDRRGIIERRLQPWISTGRIRVSPQVVDPANVNEIALLGGVNVDVDLLSIDVDGNDLWIWRALTAVRPRVVVIEYNATWRPPLTLAVHYQADWQWDGSNYFGASLGALEEVGNELGYALVGCCIAGVNAFFVRKDLCGENLFLSPFTAEEHFEPARYFMSALPAGHRPGIGPLMEINGRR